MLLFILLITSPNLFSLQHAHSQIESSPDISTGDSVSGNATSRTLNASDLSVDGSSTLEQEQQQQQQLLPSQENSNTSVSSISGNASEDFRTIREQYLSAWERLSFSSSFDTFLEDCFSAQSYGAYQARASNIFAPEENVCLYVEPVGFAHEEFIDEQGNPIYRINITADISVSDRQGTPLGNISSILFESGNSYRKVTELFLIAEFVVAEIQQDLALPEGNYTATYRFTDGATGESFELVKDFRIGEVVRVE